VPARLTAFGFAVVGNFEEAIGSWRRDAALWQHPNEGIIWPLRPGGGRAAGRRGGARGHARPLQDLQRRPPTDTTEAQGSTAGVPPQPGHLQSVVGLVWRSVVLWMLLVALLSLANVLG
jgi:adenosylcobinamide-phosphate synthase